MTRRDDHGRSPECSQSRRVVSNAVSMMSSSGQCCGMRRVVGVPIPKPLTSTGWFGRSRARSADVNTNVATPSTGMSQSYMQIGSESTRAPR